MPSIDERIVSMAFENKVFEQRVATTMATLSKLDTAVKNIGVSTGLSNLEAEANKVTLQGPMSALDKLKAKFGGASADAAAGLSGIDQAGNQVTLQGPMSALDKLKAKLGGAGRGASEGLGQIDQAGNKVTLQGPTTALDRLDSKLAQAGAGANASLGQIDQAGNKVKLEGPTQAVDKLQGKLGQLSGDSTFADIEGAANRVTLSGLTNALAGVTNKFSVLQAAASVALGNITSTAMMKGAAFAKSFGFGPIMQGFNEYSTNLKAIQTTLANTASQGTNLQDVNKNLAELNEYSDQTIYNFGEMAKNIGTFTAAGVKLDTATASIKGIANVAALSGSSSEQASTAMYQLSQSIAQGKVGLQDWNSVVNAGMGGEVLQKSLFETGKAMGTLKNVPMSQTFEEWKKAGNSFRESLSATQKEAKSGAGVVKTAQKEAAASVIEAQQSAAESVENAAERVKEAQSSYAESVTTAAERVKDAQTSAKESIAGAAERVKEAQVGVAEAAKQSAADVAVATQAQSDTIKQAGQDVRDALDSVREARKRLAEAMKPPSADELEAAGDRLKTAQLDQADLSGAVTDAQKEQQRASEDLSKAQGKLAALKANPKASAEEIQTATRAVEDAEKRVTDSADAETRARLKQSAAVRDVNQAAKDLQTTKEKGTKKDANVKSAQDALTQATTKYKDAQVKAQKDIAAAANNVRDVQKKSAEDQMKAGQNLANAQKEQAKTVANAQKSVTDAQKDQAKTIIDGQKRIAEAQKDEAKTTAEAQKKIADAHTKAADSIKAAKDSISKDKGAPKSWLTSDVLTSTLEQFTGDLTDAELAAKGFTKEQIKAIQQQAKTAKAAATEVKTLPQAFDIARETIGSGWSRTFSTIFGNFEESKGTFTKFSQTINGFINTNADARNKVLDDWKKLGGRTALIEGITSAFKNVLAVLTPIKDAFREIFPPKTGKELFEMTEQFRKFMEHLRIGPETADNLKRTFKGLFAVLGIGWEVIKGVAGVIFDLFGAIGKGSGGFLETTASIGDFLVSVHDTLIEGELLKKFFEGLGSVIKAPVGLIRDLAKALFGLFDGGDSDKLKDSVDGVVMTISPLEKFIIRVKNAWEKLSTAFGKAKEYLEPWFSAFTDKLSGFGDIIANALKTMDFDKTLSLVQTGLVASVLLTLKKAFSEEGVIGQVTGSLKGILEGISGVLGGLTDHLKAMQQDVKAGALLKIGAAVLVLAGGIFILSTIDGDKLAKAMTAVAVGLGELMGALKLMSAGGGKFGAIQLAALATGMIGMAIAITIMAGAVKIFSTMSWEDIGKGLAGIVGAIVGIGLAMKLMPGGPTLVIQAAGLVLLGVALNAIAAAVTIFSTVSWEELLRGLIGVVGSLLGIAAAMTLMPPTLPLTAAGLILLGVALNAIAFAVKTFAEMDIFKMVQGLVGMTAAIVGIGLAMSFIPPTIGITALGLLVLGGAMVVVAGAVALLGNMDMGTLLKGIIGLAAVLVVLAAGLTLMIVALPGALALAVVAAGLAVLVPVLGVLGTMKWGTIFKGLAALGLILITVAIGGLIAAPALLALGIALIPLGLALMLVATAAKIFAAAVKILSSEGQKGLAVLIAAITAFVLLIPTFLINLVKGLLSVIEEVANIAPKVVEALRKILNTIIAFIIEAAPKLALAVTAIIKAIVDQINQNSQPLIEAGFKLLGNILTGISQNIGPIMDKGAEIITKFLDKLTEKAPDLVAAGARTIVSFLTGITNNLPKLVATVATMITRFIDSVTANIPRIVTSGANLIVKFLESLTKELPRIQTAGVNLILKYIEGVGKALPEIVKAAARVAKKFINTLADELVGMADAAATALIRFLNGLARVIRERGPEIRKAGWNIASAIVSGIIDGFKELAYKVLDAAKWLIKQIPDTAKRFLGIDSPSKVFAEIGRYTMAGLAVGIEQESTNVNKSMASAGENIIDTAKSTLSSVPNLLDGLMDMDPVIAPVLDLSKVEQEAGKLGTMMPTPTLTADTSFDQATRISDQKAALDLATAATAAPVAPAATVKFEQNNYSPDPISNIELYRQTNNQLSRLKSLVGV